VWEVCFIIKIEDQAGGGFGEKESAFTRKNRNPPSNVLIMVGDDYRLRSGVWEFFPVQVLLGYWGCSSESSVLALKGLGVPRGCHH